MSSRTFALLCALGLGSVGCAPTCQQVCHKLDRCALNGKVSVAECAGSCESDLAVYKDTDYDADKTVFNDQRRCLGSHSCEEIEAGACYDATLAPYVK